MAITHAKVSTLPDGPDPALVQKTDWNDDHAGFSHTGIADVLPNQHHVAFVQADADLLYETIGAVAAHAAAPDPHTVYGALAQAETWALLQTFSAGIKMGPSQSIQDDLGAARIFILSGAGTNIGLSGRLAFVTDPAFITTPTDDARISIGDTLAFGDDATAINSAMLSFLANRSAGGVGDWRMLNINPVVSAGVNSQILMSQHIGGTFTGTGFTGLSGFGLQFVPAFAGGTWTELSAIQAELRMSSNPIVTTLRSFWAKRPVFFQYFPGVGSGTVLGADIEDLGHANIPTAIGLRIANQTGSATARLIEALGLSSTNLRVDAGDPPNAALATEGDSAMFLAWMENGVVNLRRVRWRQQSSLGATDKVLIAA